MATKDDYVKQYLKNTQSSYDTQKNTLRQTTDAANKIALDAKEASDAAINENYGTQIADTEDTYESELKKNEVQRVLNERQIERRMAEMGLTDSGLNRTQSTAVQLSYANQKGDLMKQRQKAVDTLAAAMRSAQKENALNYNATVAQNEAEYNSTVAQWDSERETAAQNYGLEAYNADVEAENERIKAQNEAIEKQAAAKTALIDIITKKNENGSSYYSDDDIEKYIRNYVGQYGGGMDFLQSIGYEKIAYEGWGPYEWKEYFENMRDEGLSIGVIKKEIARLNSEGILRGQNLGAAFSAITVTK